MVERRAGRSRMLRVELRRMACGPGLWLGIAATFLIYRLGILGWYTEYNLIYVFMSSLVYSTFTFLFPLCAVLPYGLSYLEDRRQRMWSLLCTRCTAGAYLNARFLAVALSGFLSICLGTLLYAALLPVLFPYGIYDRSTGMGTIFLYMLEAVRQGNWVYFFGFYGVLHGLAGAFWGVFALALSAYVKNAYAVYLVPVLCYRLLDVLFMNCGLPALTTISYGMWDFETGAEAMLQGVVTFGALILACYAAFRFKAGRQCRE